MGTTDSLHGGDHWQSLVGQDREGADYVTSLLKAVYDKMGVMEGKMDLLQSSVNQIRAAVLPEHQVTDNHEDTDEDEDTCRQRQSSSFLVINSHNSYSFSEKPPTPSTPDSPQAYPSPPRSRSPVSIVPANSSEPLKALKESIKLQTNHTFPNSSPDHESSDEEEEENDDDDSESSTSEEEAEFTTVQMEFRVEEIPEVEKPVANKNNNSEFNTAETKTPVAKRNGLVNFGFSKLSSRAESPLPETVNFAHAGYGWCKRKGVDASDDNRAKYFHKAVTLNDKENTEKQQKDHSDPVSDSATSPEKPPADSDLPDDMASGGFVPNNQLVSTSGFKNDHGPSDNRFDDEAHSETRSFLTTVRPELTNMVLIQHDARSPDHTGMNPTRPPIQTTGVLQDHVSPTGAGFDTGVSLASRNARNSPRSGAGSPVDASVRPSSGSSGRSDTEREAFVGDAYIQALIQTQKKEAEANTELKSQGLDTVICLDTSQSMYGKPLQLAKDAIYTFLDGVETATVEFDLEENVSIVTFGNENKVQQHLTNNYDSIRDKVESLEAGGPSPLWLGLAMALTELGTRGGSCKMSELSVLPRIIVISDGFATEKNRLSGMDGDVTEEKTRNQIQSLVAKNTGSVSSIDCITVGVNNKSLLFEISGGRVSTGENLQHLVEFFRMKSITNECLLRSKDGQMTEMKLRGMIQACNLQEQRSIDDVVWDVKGRIPLAEDSLPDESATEPWPAEAPTEQQETEVPTETQEIEVPMETQENEEPDMKPESDPASSEMETSISERNQVNMSETIQPGHLPEDVAEFPAFGTRVRSCPGSEDYVNTQDMVGTVVGHRKDRLKVLWADGMIEKCRYGDNGHFDVRVYDDFDRDNSVMKIGARVQRGADWKWEEQDGGEGSVGIVFKVDDRKKVVLVVWANNQQGNYRYGYKDCYDVELAPNEPETIQQEKEEDKVVWEIQLQESRWQIFPEEVSQSLEDMYSVNSRNTFLIKTNDISYRISLTQYIARDLETQKAYPIRRQVMSREAWLELLREQ